MEIRDDRVLLRFPCPADASALVAAGSDPEVARWMRPLPFSSVDDAEAHLRELDELREAGRVLSFGIVVDGEACGLIDLSDVRRGRSIVTTWIDRRRWGTGVNTAAKSLIAVVAFEMLNCSRISAGVNEDNPRSARALERCGYRLEGRLGAWFRDEDAERDGLWYGLLARDWSAPAEPYGVRGGPPAVFVQDPRPPAPCA